MASRQFPDDASSKTKRNTIFTTGSCMRMGSGQNNFDGMYRFMRKFEYENSVSKTDSALFHKNIVLPNWRLNRRQGSGDYFNEFKETAPNKTTKETLCELLGHSCIFYIVLLDDQRCNFLT